MKNIFNILFFQKLKFLFLKDKKIDLNQDLETNSNHSSNNINAGGVLNTKKLFLLILVSLIIGSFGIFGIFDFIKDISSNNYIAKIGNKKISFSEFEKKYQLQGSKLVKQYGSSSELEKIIMSQDFKNIILSDIINKELAIQYLKKIGININYNDTVELIKNDEKFKTANRFDKNKFTQYLATLDVSQNDYIQNYVYELSSLLLLQNIIQEPIMENEILEKYMQSQSQLKHISLYKLDKDFLNKITPNFQTTINERDIKQYYEKYKSKYIVPKSKNIEYVNLFDEFYKTIDISDNDAKKFYDTKIYPIVHDNEKRNIYSALFNNEKDASDALKEIKSGQKFETVISKRLKKPIASFLFKDVKRNDFDKSLSLAIFSMKPGQVSNVIKNNIGYYIIKLDSIVDDKTKKFEYLKQEIKDSIKFDNACEKTKDIYSKAESFSIENPNFDDLKNKFNLNFIKDNIVEDVNIVNKNEKNKKLYQEVFKSTQSDEYPLFFDNFIPSKSCDYYIVKVKNTIPESYRNFEDVKGDILKNLENEEITNKLLAISKDFQSFSKKPDVVENDIFDYKYSKYNEDFILELRNLFKIGNVTKPIVIYDSNNKKYVIIAELVKKSNDNNYKNIPFENIVNVKTKDVSSSITSDSYKFVNKSFAQTIDVEIYNNNFKFLL